MAKMTPEERSAYARHAVNARWAAVRAKQGKTKKERKTA